MAEIVNEEEPGMVHATEGISNGQSFQSGEALTEWRSSDQVENGTPSTSPPYWDSDDDDDCGPKPLELFGRHTWKIDKFSDINKRELRSDVFEAGGYKWYILIYPQGCDVCNHLSLFLCVANHDKLLPGWSHFAQFTIAVVNKDPKKSKYSDTLHRFWKKEHDWGWKKFMELPKLQDGFIDDSDTLIIKAQVQVIRERVDRPFRCLDCQYRRELVRVYLTNVEQICRRFVEERRSKLGRLIEDKARWTSFCAFWLGMDQNSRRRMSREKMDVILKVVVKHFFIEKEVTSTLVMDSLYSGLKAFQGQLKSKKSRPRILDAEELPAPIVSVDKDMFVLVDDVLLLLERAALEPLPPKDEKGPQNRTKDGNTGEEFNREAIERDERRLTELGRRTIEIFVLAHIFSNKIEVAYQEAIALKRQEELIREEEEAWLAGSEQRAKRGVSEKEKKSKKKQAKQRRNKNKGKEKRREEKVSSQTEEKYNEEKQCGSRKDSPTSKAQLVAEKPDTHEDVSDISDSVDGSAEILQPDSEDRDSSPVHWDTDTSEILHSPMVGSSRGRGSSIIMPNGFAERKNQSVIDDSSSTCSNDSIQSVVANGSFKGNTSSYQNKKSPNKGKNRQSKVISIASSLARETDDQSSMISTGTKNHNHVSEGGKMGESKLEVIVSRTQEPPGSAERSPVKEHNLPQTKQNVEDLVDMNRLKEKSTAVPSSPRSAPKNLSSPVRMKSEKKSIPSAEAISVKKASSNGSFPSDQALSSSLDIQSQSMGPRSEIPKAAVLKPAEKPVAQPASPLSRPSSAPTIPPLMPAAPFVSVVQTSPLLARSASSAGRLGPDPSPPTPTYLPQSYRNAIVGGKPAGSSSFAQPANPPATGVNQLPVYSQPLPVSAAYQSGFPFSVSARSVSPCGPLWRGSSSSQPDTTISVNRDTLKAKPYMAVASRAVDHVPSGDGQIGWQAQSLLTDDFPHLDIINDLLEEEHVSNRGTSNNLFHVPQQLFNSQYVFHGGDRSISGELLSCRSRSYSDEGFHNVYGHFDTPRDYTTHAACASPYANGQMEGLIQAQQWQMASMDLSLLAMRNSDEMGYPYVGVESPNPNLSASRTNGNTELRRSNGQ